MIGLLLLSIRNERKLELTGDIALARLGPILVEYLPNLSAITLESMIDLPSHLKNEGNEGLLVC